MIVNKIFEPFSLQRAEKGTGLGLSMVYGAVKEHNGYIAV
jgi:signal transduction histidine kinase